MELNAPKNQTVGQSLTLECNITTVRGITSRVDIVWRINGEEVKRIKQATAKSTLYSTELYVDTFYIPVLRTNDDGRVIQCKIVTIAAPSIVVADNITVNAIGKSICICMYH